jgi:hypothetical protein
MGPHVTIPARFCGPPGAGNGGYCAGLAATVLGGAAEVTLRRPVPTGRPLRMERGETVVLADGDAVLLEARPTALVLDVPPPPSFAAACAMSRAFPGFARHPFPRCFVCGPARAAGDGLRIFPGANGVPGLVSAPWIPDASLAGADGRVRPEFLWAALDCPGCFAVARAGEAAVLGRITAAVDPAVVAGEPCVVAAWPLRREGRKLEAATALYDAAGTPRGRSVQTWIVTQPPKGELPS